MIQIVWQSEERNVKSKLSELTIFEFEFIAEQFNKPGPNLPKWMAVAEYFTGFPEEEILEWPQSLFQKLVDNMFAAGDLGEPLPFIEFNGERLTASITLTMRAISKIEKIFAAAEPDSVSRSLAVVFGSELAEEQEALLVAHIKTMPTVGLIPHFKYTVKDYFDYLTQSNPIKVDEPNVETV